MAAVSPVHDGSICGILKYLKSDLRSEKRNQVFNQKLNLVDFLVPITYVVNKQLQRKPPLR